MRTDLFGEPVPIATAELLHVPMALLEPFVTGFGTSSSRAALLVHLVDEEGHEGWGEIAPFDHPFYLPETTSTTWSVVTEWALPLALGVEPTPLVVAHAISPIRGNNFARSGVESAYWVLASHRTGRSLASLFASHASSADASEVRPRVRVGESVSIHETIEETLAHVAKRRAEGYSRIKLKIRPGFDVEVVAAVRALLGPDALLQVDANSSYRREDVAVLQALDRFDLLCIEQPLDWDDIEGHIEIQAALSTPICLDECLRSVAMTDEAIRRGAARNVNLKPARVGGPSASLAIYDLCNTRGVDLWCGGMLESGIGRALNLAMASLPGFTQPGDLAPPSTHYASDLVEPSYELDPDGTVLVPSEPGVGFPVNRDRIDDATIRRFVAR